jgi:hypothetical protein
LHWFWVLSFGLQQSASGDQLQQVRAFRDLEFDYISWTMDALGVKLSQFALQAVDRQPEAARRQVVLEHLDLIGRINQAEAHLNDIYADPDLPNPEIASRLVRTQLASLEAHREILAPLAESILQSQISQVAAELGLAVGGETIPPVLYHSTPLPTALIVSPRDAIRQDANISMKSDLPADERNTLEQDVDQT